MENNRFTAIITDLDSEGRGVGRLGDGRVVFIPNAIRGEKVEGRIDRSKKQYATAKLERIIESSMYRVLPACPVYERCGGCNMQHISYAKQLEFKTSKVVSQLCRIGGMETVSVKACQPSQTELNYRNKAVFRLLETNGKIELGFLAEGSHIVIPSNYCHICSEGINKAAKIIKNYFNDDIIKKDEGSNKAAESSKAAECSKKAAESSKAAESNKQAENNRAADIRFINSVQIRELENNILIEFTTTKRIKIRAEELQKELASVFNEVSIQQTYEKAGRQISETIAGEGSISGNTLGIEYKVFGETFLQVNTNVAKSLYSSIIENEISENDVVIDAYSGVGILSALIAKKAQHVYAIEIVEKSTMAANLLVNTNNIQNITVLNGDCSNILPPLLKKLANQRTTKRVSAKSNNFSAKNTQAGDSSSPSASIQAEDSSSSSASIQAAGESSMRMKNTQEEEISGRLVVIIDPPRKGCSKAVIDAIKESLADKIIYISCDSATLARDIKALTSIQTNCESNLAVEELNYASNLAEKKDKYGNDLVVEEETNFKIESISPFDMFPQTSNVETLTILSKKSN